ncbi:TerD family protein [Streptomyces sp. LPB2020-019-1HS]|uniref:TerD family protein n=1 Tax=Streptomyces sp. LPB2020-019-1HS TaxID=3409689 RepID=UPI003B67FBAF
MSVALTKGGNVSLSKQAPGLTGVTVGLGWQANTGYELDASALLCDGSGTVPSDEHFVFFNNLTSPDGSVRHCGSGAPVDGDDQRIEIDLLRVPGDINKIVFPVSLYEAAARGQTFAQVHRAHIRVLDREGGAELARYDLATGSLAEETALVFGELYRHGGEWKFRAVGQGYASGLAGIAEDYGVDVLKETAAPEPPAATGPTPPAASAMTAPAAESAAVSPPPAPAQPPAAPPPAPAQPPAAPPPAPAQPAAAPPPMAPETAAAFSALPDSFPGSDPMTCFFDPQHGTGTVSVTWSPQWGVPRPVQACGACAQRVQTTVPPFYAPAQQGYPQPAPQPYPGQGYPQQGGYPPQYAEHEQQGGGRRFGTGALIGAGAAGLIGGALLNEAFDDDEPDVVINNYYED